MKSTVKHTRKKNSQNQAWNRARYNLRARLNALLSGKDPKAYSIRKQVLLYSSDELRAHLEAQFTAKMDWNNYGLDKFWEIDHIIPCANFDLTQLDQAIACFGLKNLKPCPVPRSR